MRVKLRDITTPDGKTITVYDEGIENDIRLCYEHEDGRCLRVAMNRDVNAAQLRLGVDVMAETERVMLGQF